VDDIFDNCAVDKILMMSQLSGLKIAGAILLSVGFWLAIDKNSFVRLVTKISQDTALHVSLIPLILLLIY
jgi:hypothetical protein